MGQLLTLGTKYTAELPLSPLEIILSQPARSNLPHSIRERVRNIRFVVKIKL
jgi:hypothetical protein